MSAFHRIPTKASVHVSNSTDDVEQTEFEVVVHKRRERKVKSAAATSDTKSKKDHPDTPVSFDIKRARHDVIRFGATGLGVKEKKNAQIALAVKLGAKPPKGTPKSLKEFHQERRAVSTTSNKDVQQGLQAKAITNFQSNQLISTAQRRKRKQNDVHNTIRDYGKVTKT